MRAGFAVGAGVVAEIVGVAGIIDGEVAGGVRVLTNGLLQVANRSAQAVRGVVDVFRAADRDPDRRATRHGVGGEGLVLDPARIHARAPRGNSHIRSSHTRRYCC